MKFKYAIIGLDTKASANLTTQVSGLAGYEQVGYTHSHVKLLDLILSGTPNLIYLNVDGYNEIDYYNFTTIINDLYRTFVQKPYVIAIASSKIQAYDCIKNNFYYYLLQPFSELQLQKLDYKLKSELLIEEGIPKKLCLQTYSEYRFVEIQDILFLKADNNATEFVLIDNSKIVAYKTLKHFEKILPKSFSRIHQSFIINQKYISRIHLGKSECQLKSLKTKLPFSKTYRNVMTKLADNLSSNSLT